MLKWEESKLKTRKREVDKDGFVTWKKPKPKTRRKNIRETIEDKIAQQEKFVMLGMSHFFYNSLEMVLNKYWLSKGKGTSKVNIFIIGETHHTRNNVANGTYETFYAFMQELQQTDISVDILLEVSDDSMDIETIPLHNPAFYQITNIRNLLHQCIRTHACGKLRVHWVDGDYSKHPYMISKRFSPTIHPLTIAEPVPKKTLRNALDAMPLWLKRFYENYQEDSDGNLIATFGPELLERFKTVSGI